MEKNGLKLPLDTFLKTCPEKFTYKGKRIYSDFLPNPLGVEL